MAEPQLEFEKRLDRIETAILFVAEKALYFEDQSKVAEILGREDDSEQGSEHHPDSERQEEPGPEIPDSSDGAREEG